MSTDSEKLIEIWLDSASEREYQFGFRSALIFAGYKVLHNTSHTALELGKDVIAIDPSGSVIAYQLKGNPSGRLTISQWHALIPQINALVYQPLIHPNIKPGTQYQPFLVTNGEVHEDVLAAIVGYNAEILNSGRKVLPLQTMARGELLSFVLRHSKKIWPVDLGAQRRILNLMAANGEDALPDEEFSHLIEQLLGLDAAETKFKMERVAAAHLVTSLLAANWQKHENYFEVIKMFTLLYVKIASYVSRTNTKNRQVNAFLSEIEFSITRAISEFLEWVEKEYDEKPLLNGDIFSEFSYFHIRKRMLMGLFSVLVLDERVEIKETTYEYLWNFICKNKSKGFLSGEFIIPYCLAVFWAQSKIQGSQKPDYELAYTLRALLDNNGQEDIEAHIPGPYYNIVESVEWHYSSFIGVLNRDLEEDNHYERGWFTRAIFYLLVRRNMKCTCQLLWYRLTKFLHTEIFLESDWEFGLYRSERARQQDIQLRVPQSWADVVETAEKNTVPKIPEVMMDKPVLVLLYCLFVPYRMNYDVVMWLDRKLSRSSWY